MTSIFKACEQFLRFNSNNYFSLTSKHLAHFNMSFKFSGISSLCSARQLIPNSVASQSSSPTNVTNTISSKESDELSSLNEYDLVSDDEELEDSNDSNSLNNDGVSHSFSDDDNDDEISVISSTSNKSTKKLDADIQSEIWSNGLQQLNAYTCNCTNNGCTQNVSINQVVYTREMASKEMATALMRRKFIFSVLAAARLTASKQLRYVRLM